MNGHTAPRRGRLRTRQACEPCRSRKRKCDGKQPCGKCVQHEYECSFRGTNASSIHPETPPSLSTRDPSGTQHQHDQRIKPNEHEPRERRRTNVKANSGIAFPFAVGAKLQLPKQTLRVQNFGWNLGIGNNRPPAVFSSLSTLINKADMLRLAAVYFKRVHPIYGFLEERTLMERIDTRWKQNELRDTELDDEYDPVLCGVAVLGALFSGSDHLAQELQLTYVAKQMLETAIQLREPSPIDGAACLLRTIVLRISSTPYAAWMASCTTMHVLEAAGAYEEGEEDEEENEKDPAHETSTGSSVDAGLGRQYRRRLVWSATILNSWISNECGRSPVTLRDANCRLPLPQRGDFTTDLIHLYHLSQVLNPDQPRDVSDLNKALVTIGDLNLADDALILSQSNLALAIYRRLRQVSNQRPSDSSKRVIEMGLNGVAAAVRLADAQCPWWHVANVPFQLICVFLAMDNEAALSHIGYIITSLRTIADSFESSNNVERAMATAETLIRLSQSKKERELNHLSNTCSLFTEGSGNPYSIVASQQPSETISLAPVMDDANPQATFDWDWDWDWDVFFNVADAPVFPI